jgi:hypothetical protein
MTPRDAALSYASLGWPVLPIRPRSKLPATEHGLTDATCDAAQIRAWWERWPEAGVGIALAPAGLCAVDVDPRNGGALEALPEQPDTLTARTGGGGWHLLFKVPEGATLPGKLGPGLDVKHRGYILAEPSVHPSGRGYSWLDWEVAREAPVIAPAPGWLLAPKVNGTAHDPERERDPFDVARAVREVLTAERFHDNLRDLAAHYAAKGLPGAELESLLRGLLLAVDGRDERWQARFDAIPKAARSAVEKFAPKPSEAPPPPRYVCLANLEADPPPPRRWVVEDWIPRGHVTALMGRGGTGKSLLLQQLGTHVALCEALFGVAVSAGPVLSWFCEDDPDELRRRQAKLFDALCRMSIDSSRGLFFEGRAGIESTLLYFDRDRKPLYTPALDLLRSEVERVRPVLVGLDNAAQLFGGVENDRQQVTAFANLLTGLARRYDCGVLLLGHTAKAADSEFSGSTAWDAAVRSRLWLDRNEDGTLTLHRRKANYSATDSITLEWQAGAFVPVSRDRADSDAARVAEAAVLAALDTLTARQVATSHNPTATTFLPRLMKREDLLGSASYDAARRALAALLDRDEIVPNARLGWRKSDRHDALGLARRVEP